VDMHILQAGPTLTVEAQFKLTAPCSSKDIKEAMWSIAPIKSPGPDGYSSNFFKACWGEISPKVCEAV